MENLEINPQTKRLEFINKEGLKCDVSVGFKVIEIKESLEVEKIKSKIIIEVYFPYVTNKFEIPFEIVSSSSELRKYLFKYGVIYKEFFEHWVNEYVVEGIQALQVSNGVINITHLLGWQNVNNEAYPKFILDKYQSKNRPLIEYYDKHFQFKKGTLEGQLEFIEEEILPYKETRMALTIGLASIVAGYIEPHKSIGTLVINVCGKSSTGKSSIMEIAGSMFANPELSNYGIVRTFNATENFIMSMCEGRNGIPILLDDINSNKDEHSKQNLIYQLASQEPRARCKNNGDTQIKRDKWSGLAIITSENPLLNMEALTQGSQARTLTLSNIQWTQSAEHSETIKAKVKDNYGYLGIEIANIIQNMELKEILDKQDSYSNEIYKKMEIRDSFSNRISSKMAPIVITAELINKFYCKEAVNVNEVIDFLVQNEQKSICSRAIDEMAYENLLSFIYYHQRNFNRYNIETINNIEYIISTYDANGEVYGTIFARNEKSYILIDKTAFKKFLTKYQILEKTTVLNGWFEDGLIERPQKDRFIIKANKELNSPHYKIYLSDYDLEKFETTKLEYNCKEIPVCNTIYDDEEEIDKIFKEGN